MIFLGTSTHTKKIVKKKDKISEESRDKKRGAKGEQQPHKRNNK